ncbi:DUF1489 family protein [Curvivirga sp.]|uniref:DUF1489 family protein n=1 Tax=Curvivirga sp. TaxID=2856848 RepID=UPI003B5B0A95
MSDISHENATIHLRKLCVGVESVEQLQEWQRINLPKRGGKIWHITRSWPKRAEELLKGGSLFWIIKGSMSVRQPIVGFEEHPSEDPDEKPKCRILLGPELVKTQPWPHRPFQGWRYLKPEEAPPDINMLENGETESMPAEMIAELKSLGLM